MEEQLVRLINKNDLEEFKKIIENGFDINKKFSYLRNALFEDILNEVERDNINRHVDFHNYKGNSLLHYACIVSRIEVVNDKKKYNLSIFLKTQLDPTVFHHREFLIVRITK